MTGEVVNLRQRRKAAARQAAKAQAAANAARHGRSKAERDAMQARAARAARDLEGHRRETGQGRGEGRSGGTD